MQSKGRIQAEDTVRMGAGWRYRMSMETMVAKVLFKHGIGAIKEDGEQMQGILGGQRPRL